PFSYSYPLTTSPHATSWSPSTHQRLFLMRLRCSGQSRLKDTLLVLSVARYSRTGMATIPKLMTPRQMDRGIPHLVGRDRRAFSLGFPARRSRANCTASGPDK